MIISAPVKLNNTAISLPLSKSLANRLMILSFLSGKSLKEQPADSDDSILMKRLLEDISENISGRTYTAEHAGTVFRFVSAILALTPGEHILTGSERMQQRPCSPLVDALNQLGADIEYLVNTGYPPLRIKGGSLKGGRIEIDSSLSSQFISSLLMIGPYLDGGLDIILTGNIVSLPYIHMTIKIMQECGITVSFVDNKIHIPQGNYKLTSNMNEADWSAASYWFTLVALCNNSRITLQGLKENSLQGDKSVVDIFKKLGVESMWHKGDLTIYNSGNVVSSLYIDLLENPDLAPSVAVACAGLQVKAELTGLETLAIKESNRLEALEIELAKLGYSCKNKNNNTLLISNQKQDTRNRIIQTYNDHRIAMSLSLLSTRIGNLVIEDPKVVTKSYPNYWKDLEMAGFRIKY